MQPNNTRTLRPIDASKTPTPVITLDRETSLEGAGGTIGDDFDEDLKMKV